MSRMEKIAGATDKMEMFDGELDDLSALVFADARPLQFDVTGRIIIPEDLLKHANITDTALFVVKQDYAKASNIMEGIAQLAESHVHISGCVLNGVKAGIGGYGYKYYQYYNRYGNYREGSRYGKEE